jgi:hypothetical protein
MSTTATPRISEIEDVDESQRHPAAIAPIGRSADMQWARRRKQSTINVVERCGCVRGCHQNSGRPSPGSPQYSIAARSPGARMRLHSRRLVHGLRADSRRYAVHDDLSHRKKTPTAPQRTRTGEGSERMAHRLLGPRSDRNPDAVPKESRLRGSRSTPVANRHGGLLRKESFGGDSRPGIIFQPTSHDSIGGARGEARDELSLLAISG